MSIFVQESFNSASSGKYRDAISRKATQLSFLEKMESVQEEVEESATSGRLNVVLGRQLLEVEGVSFLPAVHLCEAGAIPQDELCGKLLY